MWKNKRKNRRLGGKYMNVGDYVRTDIGIGKNDHN